MPSQRSRPSEKNSLRGILRRRRPPELRGIERLSRGIVVEPEPGCGLAQALTHQIGPDTLPAHARAERGVVVLSTAHVAHACHHPCSPFGEVLLEPLLEQRIHFPWQAQHNRERAGRSGRGRGFEDTFEFRFVDEGDQR